MSGVVSGYTGIIAPSNLIANGGFQINQRGNFDVETTGTQVAVGDYVSDMWKVGTINIDYCAAINGYHIATVIQRGLLRLFGYGKKGQLINIHNRAPQDGVQYWTTVGSYYGRLVTTSVGCSNQATTAGVPVKVSCTASDYTLGTIYYDLYDAPAIIKKGQRGRAVNIKTTYPVLAGSARIIVELQEDGEFDFTVGGFNYIMGGFKNPPDAIPVYKADDLGRCQRYYQKGTYRVAQRAAIGPAGNISTYWAGSYPLQVPMAVIPTFSVATPTAFLFRDVSGNATDKLPEYNGTNGKRFYATTASSDYIEIVGEFGGLTNPTEASSYGFEVRGTWTAEIA